MSKPGRIEIVRRIGLVLGAFVGFFLFMFPSRFPLYELVPKDFVSLHARTLERFHRYQDTAERPPSLGLFSDSSEQGLTPPRPGDREPEAEPPSISLFVERATKGKRVTVSGEAWESFLAALRSGEGAIGGLDLNKRVSSRSWSDPSYFFGAGEISLLDELELPEPPLDPFMEDGEYYLATESGWERAVGLRVFSRSDVDPSSPSSSVAGLEIPFTVFFPYRPHAWIPMALGLCGFILLPFSSPRLEAESFTARQVLIVTDVFGALVAAFFFALPLWIAGDSIRAFTTYLPLTAVFLVLASSGIALLVLNAHYASVSLSLSSERLTYTHFRGIESVPFVEIDSLAAIEKDPPRWLTIVFLLAGIFGQPGDRALAAGNLAGMSDSKKQGFSIARKDGRNVSLWLTDATGNPLLRHHEELMKTLPARLAAEGVRVELPAESDGER